MAAEEGAEQSKVHKAKSDRERVRTLELWGIKPGVPPSSRAVREFLTSWVGRFNSNLLITEQDDVDSESSSSVFGWLAEALVANSRIKTFIFKVNAVTCNLQNFEESAEVRGKFSSADLVWVEELTACELTIREKTALYSFLSDVFSRAKRVVITTTVTPETILTWIGLPSAKLVTRNTEIIEI